MMMQQRLEPTLTAAKRNSVSPKTPPPHPSIYAVSLLFTSHIGSGYVGITIDDKILHRLQVFAPAATPDAATRRQPPGRQTSKHSDPVRF